MNCLEFRQLKLADPYTSNKEANLHQSGCSSCAMFEREIHELDDSLRTALTVAVPEGFAAKVLLNQSLQSHPRRPTRWYWLSLAASFFFAVALFQFSPADTLDDEIVAHMDNEVHQVHGKSGDISESAVRAVLLAVGGDIDHPLGTVTYASKCLMDDMLVAHFVVKDGEDTYTLILIPEEINDDLPFLTERWRGMVTPHPTGSLAVIASTQSLPAPDFLRLAKRYGSAIKRTTI
jgi:Protein of unknown function (DUF3379)